jgi:subtilisin-like proprotein convertase family protein
MKTTKIFIVLFLIFSIRFSFAQTFSSSPNAYIPDGGGFTNMLRDSIWVNGLQNFTDTSFGLNDIEINVHHTYDADLTMWLISPSGNKITLVQNLGGGDSNFVATHFNNQNNTNVYFGSAPFTGNFQPIEWMGIFNNGQNPNGKWVLQISDCCAIDSGTLISWHLTFGNQPAKPLPDSTSLPIIKVNTNSNYIIDEPKVMAQMTIIDNKSGMNHYNDHPSFQGIIGIEYRGSTSQTFPEKPYAVQTWDANGNNIDTSILGFPSNHDWIFYPPFDDKSMMRNTLIYKISNQMGHYASRTKYFELYLNGNYEGVYVFMEKIARDKNRVNIKKMDSTSINFPDVTGGYIFKIDKPTGAQSAGWWGVSMICDTPSNTAENINYLYDYPSDYNIVQQQQNYLQNIVTAFENSVMNFSLYDTVNGYKKYVSLKTFVDHSLLIEFSRNIDGYRWSSYYHKDRDDVDSRIKAGPIWDFNLSFGNGDFYQASDCRLWQWNLVCPGNPVWWKKFFEQDSVYRNEYKCRYTNFRQNVLSWNNINHIIDSFTNVIQIPQQKNYVRWPILGIYTWPNAYYPPTFQQEIDTLKHWIQHRLQWMDTLLYDSSCIQKIAPAGIKNMPQIVSDFSIVPNPIAWQQKFDVRFSNTNQNSTLIIYNELGDEILRENISAATQKISFSANELNLHAGIYFVRLMNDKISSTKKLVVQ